MTPSETSIAEGLSEALGKCTSDGVMRFSLCQGKGWIITTSEANVRGLCDVFNNRELVRSYLISKGS